jgi:hypothetical protein
MTHPPAGPSTPPPPSGPKHDTIFDLAASLGFQDLGRSASVAADSEGRAGGVVTAPGAVPSMPKPLGPPRFGDGRPTPGQPNPRPQPGPSPQPLPPRRSS